MLNVKRILLPVDFPLATLAVLHQAAILAQHFHAEILLLHIVTPLSHAAGVPDDSAEMGRFDLLSAILDQARKQQDASLAAALQGLKIESSLVKGDAASAIVRTAEDESVDLIMMPSFSFTFAQFLLGSVAANVLNKTEIPVWTGAHVATESPGYHFAIRNVLCGIDFGPRTDITVSWANQLAQEFGARLTLAHVTSSVQLWVPGGDLVDPKWKAALMDGAHSQLAQLQKENGLKAQTFIGSGDVPKVLSQAAKQTNADLLVTGCYPYSGHLRTHGYGIICAVEVPVLNV